MELSPCCGWRVRWTPGLCSERPCVPGAWAPAREHPDTRDHLPFLLLPQMGTSFLLVPRQQQPSRLPRFRGHPVWHQRLVQVGTGAYGAGGAVGPTKHLPLSPHHSHETGALSTQQSPGP